jgi:hypothetical protein
VGQITIRGTSVDLPVFDDEVPLEPVFSLDASDRPVSGFDFRGASVRALDVENAGLLDGKVRALLAAGSGIYRL